ncbi:Proteophosphoglycan 5 [Rhodotorula toruloides ATCC 204091]|nr:Proteophosphoglycan 5 [Rhodotorula toruloides ATCC 204091]KAK4335044.1 Proteophosphoglycan 5 [Rhodotorula toruloides]
MGQSQSTQSRSAKAGPRLKGESRETADTSTTAAEPASSSPRNRRQTISRRFQLKGRRRRQTTEAQRALREAMEQQRQAETMLADLKQERDRRPSAPQLALGANGGLEGLCIVVGEASPSTIRQASPEPSKGGSQKSNSQALAGRTPAVATLGISRLRAVPNASTMPRSLGDRSSTPGLSTSSSTVPSSPCPDQPTPKSHWSESSVGIPTPQLPFQSFRDSLNLNRLSQLFPSGTSSSATPSSPRSADLERLNDACTSDDKVVAQRSEQTKRRKTGAGRPQIAIVDAQPVGAKRYSQLLAAEEALQEELGCSERKGSAGEASIATIRPNGTRKASVVSTAGSVDVWDSDIPWPGMRQARTSTPDVALSPRFSTTPAFLAQAECLDDSLRRASDRRNTYKRRSSTLDLTGYVAASPELAFPPASASLTSLVSSSPSPPLPPKPFRRLSQMRVPAGHPASHHLRFSRTSSTSPSSPRSSASRGPPKFSPQAAGLPANANSPSPTLAALPRRRSSAGAPLAWRGRLDSVAETATSSARGGDEVPVRLGPGASRSRSSVRRFTNCTSASDVSFPHSIGTEDAESARSPTFPVTATPSPTCRDLPPLPTATSGIDFSGYTLGKPATRPISCVSTGSDLPPELVDAFPAPPLPPLPPFARPRVPTKLDLSRQARDSVLTATASSPRSLPSHASTPSTSSFASSLTSQASIDLGPKPAGPVVSVDFGAAALAGKTYRPPSSAGSVATFVLEDIIDELNSLHVEEAKGGAPGRCERLLSLEQPDPHLAEHLSPTVLASTIVPQSRSPPRFQSVFHLDKPVSTSKPLPALVSPLSHALLDDSRFDSPRLSPLTPNSTLLGSDKLHDLPPSVPASLEPSPVAPQKPWTSRLRIASADVAHRSPAQQSEARRDTYPTFVPPSQRVQQPNLFDALLEQASRADEEGGKSGGAARERRLGSKDKRGFDKVDIGAWLDRARRESEEHARKRPVVRV